MVDLEVFNVPDVCSIRRRTEAARDERVREQISKVLEDIYMTADLGKNEFIYYDGNIYDEVIELLKNRGYNAWKIDENKIAVNWRERGEPASWVERKRWDGSSFYECDACGSVAAAEKSCTCPNCKRKMTNAVTE